MSGPTPKYNPARYWLDEAEFVAFQAVQSMCGSWRQRTKPVVRVKAKSEKVNG